MTCDVCRRPEALAYLRTVVDPRNPDRLCNACRRCRLAPKVRPLWDALRLAEAAVIADPDDPVVMTALRDARVTFDLALRPVAAPRKKARR